MSYEWHWNVLLENAGAHETYLDWILDGFAYTMALGLSAWVIALVTGTLFGTLRTIPNRGLSAIAALYVEIFRNVPLIVQLFVWYFVMPELVPGGERIKQLAPMQQQFIAATLCIASYMGARICEQVRAGINSLPRGQRSAGLALGLSLPQAYRYVLVPNALRVMVPPLTSEFMSTFKNSAVASTIGLLELAAQGRQLVDYTARPYESFITVTVMYGLINLTVMVFMQWLENRTRVPGLIGTK